MLAGLLAGAVLSLGTDLVLHASGVFPWYPLSLIAIAMPCAWVGGRLLGARFFPHPVLRD
jgi:hypothetical protein